MYHVIAGRTETQTQDHHGPYTTRADAEHIADVAVVYKGKDGGYDWAVVIEVSLEAGYPTVVQGKRVVRKNDGVQSAEQED